MVIIFVLSDATVSPRSCSSMHVLLSYVLSLIREAVLCAWSSFLQNWDRHTVLKQNIFISSSSSHSPRNLDKSLVTMTYFIPRAARELAKTHAVKGRERVRTTDGGLTGPGRNQDNEEIGCAGEACVAWLYLFWPTPEGFNPFTANKLYYRCSFLPRSVSEKGWADQTYCLGNFVWRENTWEHNVANQEVTRHPISKRKILCHWRHMMSCEQRMG